MTTAPAEICTTAARLIGGERDQVHGDYHKNLGNIAAFWNAYLYARFPVLGPSLTAQDVAQLMALLKIARTLTGRHNLDDYVDAAGYVGLAGAMADGALPCVVGV